MTRERFRLRTVLIPVAAVAGFFAIQIAVVTVYMILYSFITSILDPAGAAEILSGIQDILLRSTNNIGAIYSVLAAVAALLVIRALRKGNPEAAHWNNPGKSAYFAAIVVMVGAAGLIALLMTALSQLAESVPFIDAKLQEYVELSEMFTGDGNLAMIILSTCILVPLAEELVFRGIIQGELRRVFPAWATVLIQAVIFSLVHGNLVQISYVILPALVLGLVYEWTRSLYVPIAMHMVFNFIGAAVPQMLGSDETAMMYLYVVQIAMIPPAILGMAYLAARHRSRTRTADAKLAAESVSAGADVYGDPMAEGGSLQAYGFPDGAIVPERTDADGGAPLTQDTPPADTPPPDATPLQDTPPADAAPPDAVGPSVWVHRDMV